MRRKCPYGCGKDQGFCQCGKSTSGNAKLTNRARETRGGRPVSGTSARKPGKKK